MTAPFKPCLVVPVFNPGPALARTLEGLIAAGHPLFLHDDGSDEATRAELTRFKSAYPSIRLSRWDVNQGKGAAVCEMLRSAHRAGFTHALQVDSDGQHDLGAIAAFLALGKTRPEAVIAGVPRYEGSVPAARRYGRHFTHAWVHLETLSFDIGDSLCGFRLYPLAATAQLMDRVALPARMDFDTAAIVRLHWQGVPILNAPVTVIYPEDGISHFNLLRDNLRLTRMHTRLVLGMLIRFPALLWRRSKPKPEAAPDDPHWSRIQERGTALGLRLTLWTYKLFGARALRFLTEFVAAYFFATGGVARRASRAYLARLFEQSGPLPDLPRAPRLRDSYRHVRTFAHSYVDRFLAWVDKGDREIAFPEEAAFRAQLDSGQGAIFLSAHLGNLDMLRGLGAARGYKGLNAVIHSDHVVRFQSLLKDINPSYELDLIHVRDAGPGTAMLLEEKIAKGECLFIVGDRPPAAENGRTLAVPFLGKAAPFPIGPLFLAHLLLCPVFLFFCVKESGRYTIRMERFADRIALPRKGRDEALRAWLERYALAVEAQCRATPLQWFNFYDFWGDAAPESRP
ncbi:MAG TPA: glycosyltransferase [Holophagaceae bacterium]|nr:glycosyltransferase [Holophagaceae bacterium]